MSELYNITAKETQPESFSHINGTQEQLLARFAVSELCRGWPVYRDASEWKNYRSLFTQDAKVWTSWSGGKSIDDFIGVSITGRQNGEFIMHRENGTLVDVNLSITPPRAIGKMKATITQRFTDSSTGIQYDVECDTRFIFWCLREANGDWKAQYNRLFYEKDRLVPVDGKHVPEFGEEELKRYPEGYKYLGAAQARLGHPVLTGLPTCRDDEAFWRMNEMMRKWLRGEEVDLDWD